MGDVQGRRCSGSGGEHLILFIVDPSLIHSTFFLILSGYAMDYSPRVCKELCDLCPY